MNKEKKVSLIENGTVLDHLPSKSIFKITSILELDNKESEILIGMNLKSKKSESKGLIKLNNRYLSEEEKKKIAILTKGATVSEIRNFEVKNKSIIEISESVEKIVKCINPNCITSNESMSTKFKVVDKENLKLKCIYCEKFVEENNIVII